MECIDRETFKKSLVSVALEYVCTIFLDDCVITDVQAESITLLMQSGNV